MAPITLIVILIYNFYILFTVISNILSNSTPIFFSFHANHTKKDGEYL